MVILVSGLATVVDVFAASCHFPGSTFDFNHWLVPCHLRCSLCCSVSPQLCFENLSTLPSRASMMGQPWAQRQLVSAGLKTLGQPSTSGVQEPPSCPDDQLWETFHLHCTDPVPLATTPIAQLSGGLPSFLVSCFLQASAPTSWDHLSDKLHVLESWSQVLLLGT